MSERISMNTKSLQKHFKAEYEDFFAKNDLIVSGCFTGPLAPIWVGHFSKSMRIKTKLPTKMYLWVNINQDWNIIFKKASVYKNIGNDFEKIWFHEIIDKEQEIIAFAKEFLRKNDCELGLSAEILSEMWRWYSFSFSANFAALLSMTLYMLIGKISANDIKSYEKLVESEIFKEITMTAWQIELIARYGNAIGESIYTLHAWDPSWILYCQEFDAQMSLDQIKDTERYFMPFSEVFNTPNHNDLPFDYAIVFSGLPTDSKKIEQSLQLDEKKFNTYGDFVKNHILPKTAIKKDIHFLNVLSKGIYNQFTDLFATLCIIFLESLQKIYVEGSDALNIHSLINNINNFRYLFYTLEKRTSDFIEKFVSTFENESKNKEKIGMANCYSGKIGWSCIVVMQQWSGRKYFFDAIEKMKSEYPDIVINYMSWADGTTTDWVVLEQHISEGLFSEYIKKDRVYIKTNMWENYLWDYNEILASFKDGLLLDTINNKIYLNGRKLNSGDIPSQTTTINVLDKLLDNIGKDLSNNEFEISSYSKNKNEMIGKIVIPIISLLEKEMGKKLPLICKGSIYDFYVKLNPSDIKISIIKRM